MRKKKKSKKAGMSKLSMLGPVANSDSLKSLVKQMISEEIAKGGGNVGGIMKKKSKKGGFHGVHPIEIMLEDHMYGSGMVGGRVGSGMVGGEECMCPAKVRAKRKLGPGLYPYNAAVQALKGIKFPTKQDRQKTLRDFASLYDHSMTRAENIKMMKDYVEDHRQYIV